MQITIDFPAYETFLQYVRRWVHAPAAAFTEHWQCLPGTLRITTAAVLLVFGLVCLLLFTASCAHTLQGLSREQALYQAGTNAVAQVQSLTPYLPVREQASARASAV